MFIKVQITEEVGVNKETHAVPATNWEAARKIAQEARADLPRGSVLTVNFTEVN